MTDSDTLVPSAETRLILERLEEMSHTVRAISGRMDQFERRRFVVDQKNNFII